MSEVPRGAAELEYLSDNGRPNPFETVCGHFGGQRAILLGGLFSVTSILRMAPPIWDRAIFGRMLAQATQDLRLWANLPLDFFYTYVAKRVGGPTGP